MSAAVEEAVRRFVEGARPAAAAEGPRFRLFRSWGDAVRHSGVPVELWWLIGRRCVGHERPVVWVSVVSVWACRRGVGRCPACLGELEAMPPLHRVAPDRGEVFAWLS